ncbi:MAG: hypothetical protein AW10_01905 [Candidatus Accumulibacter appositus]|uniref:Uncharacterized protein n=1 Tax=Candidatus Accumulibacter appositus TaxID=1454003 RepID=A0A011QN17_9PROT|nr:hypothetical protein [Accumulibacter sp.]EXI80259.1 MAG: hypothetical protein AW10_01905 [Candidatus Accumulibacter appositus]HRF05961.1 hypothetical protein [Accumulibacter sp.]
MALSHANSGDLVNINDAAAVLASNTLATLVRDDHIEIFRLVLSAGAHMQHRRTYTSGRSAVECASCPLTSSRGRA